MNDWKEAEAYKTIRLAVPVIIGELAQMSLHLIDTAMVGAISYKHLAAAALVMNAVNIPFVIGMGMTISVSQMVSMANGRQDTEQVSHYLFNGFFLCTVFAIIISLGLVAGRGILFHLGQDPEVAQLAYPFMRLVGFSIIPMLLFMTLKQFTDGLEYTRTAMVLSLGALPVNVFLNWLLIYGNWGFPRLELAGAGWATLITRTLIFLVLGLVILKHGTFRKYTVGWQEPMEIQPAYPAETTTHWRSQQFTIGYGGKRICGIRNNYRNHQRTCPGSASDCIELRLIYFYGFHGLVPGLLNKSKQCLWPF